MDPISPPEPTDGVDAPWCRYLEGGDPDALGEVFDRAVPSLLLLAARLVGERSGALDRAHDLVQTTFLEAIRSRGRFQRGRPVLPWLAAILTRRAVDLQRRETVRRGPRFGAEGVMEPVDGDPSPADHAEFSEVLEQVLSGLQELPPAHRTALHLRLLHGLSPAEISAALERPLNTVHSQLRRGLEQLRGRLPRGMAQVVMVGLLGGAAAERAVAVVRAQVIHAAQAEATAASLGGAVVGGSGKGMLVGAGVGVLGGVMLKWVVAVCAAAVLLLLGLEVFRGDAPVERAAVAQAGDPPAGMVAADTAPEDPGALDRQAVKPGDEGADLPPGGAPDSDPMVWGRCVDPQGQPIEGVEVYFYYRGFGVEVEAQSAADGVFRIVEPETQSGPTEGVGIRFRSTHHLERTLEDRVGDLGDVVLEPGGFLEVELVGTRIAPHNHLRLYGSPMKRLPGCRNSGATLEFKEGEWVSLASELLRPGPWAFDQGAVEITPKTFTIEAGRTTRVQVRAELPVGLSGQVLGEGWGLVMPSVQLKSTVDGQTELLASAQLDRDGRFSIWRTAAMKDRGGSLMLRAWHRGYREAEVPVQWGQTGLQIPLQRIPRVVPEIVAEDGRDVGNTYISVRPHPEEVFWRRANGEYATPLLEELGGIPKDPGRYWVRVVSSDPELAASPSIQVDLGTEDAHVRVELPVGKVVTVRVRNRDGEPLPGRYIRMLDRRAPLEDGMLPKLYAPFSYLQLGSPLPGGRPWLLDQMTTDESGVARLRATPVETRWLWYGGQPDTWVEVPPGQLEVDMVIDEEPLVLAGPISIRLPGALPDWVERAWIQEQGVERRPWAQAGKRLGDRFYFSVTPQGDYRLALVDPDLPGGPAETVAFQVKEGDSLLTLGQAPPVPACLDIPDVPEGTKLTISHVSGAEVYRTRWDSKAERMAVHPGGYVLVWEVGGEKQPEVGLRVRSGELKEIALP